MEKVTSTATISAQVPSSLLDAMKSLSQQRERSMSAEIRLALRRHLRVLQRRSPGHHSRGFRHNFADAGGEASVRLTDSTACRQRPPRWTFGMRLPRWLAATQPPSKCASSNTQKSRLRCGRHTRDSNGPFNACFNNRKAWEPRARPMVRKMARAWAIKNPLVREREIARIKRDFYCTSPRGRAPRRATNARRCGSRRSFGLAVFGSLRRQRRIWRR